MMGDFIQASRVDVLAKLEAARVCDLALDHLINWHLMVDHHRRVVDGQMQILHRGLAVPKWVAHDDPNVMAQPFTRSLDAVRGLRIPGCLWDGGHCPDDASLFRARVMLPFGTCPIALGRSPVEAIAWCIAWLRARWTPVVAEAAHA
jgi:hypothetical protein